MSRSFPLLLACGALLAACGEEKANVLPTDSTLDGGAGAAAGTACEGAATQSCFCAGSTPGNQSCTNGEWTACVCGSGAGGGPAGGSTSNVNIGGGTGDLCKAGHYVGSFTGEYFPGIGDPLLAFGGGFGSFLRVEVRALPSATEPGLAMTLEAQEVTGGSLDGVDFSSYIVRDGCVVGTAKDETFGTENPFVGVLSGSVDCDTGAFTGTMTGYYELLGFSELPFGFEGPLTAQFNPATDALEMGTWDVEEESNAADPPGGMGDWGVTWMGGVDTAPPLPQECVDFLAGNVETTSSDNADGGITMLPEGGADTATDGGVTF